MSVRTRCPSCNQRLSPLALECPVCGLGLARQQLSRPLLFQASALQAKPVQEPRKTALAAPALGRITPVAVEEPARPVRPTLVVPPPEPLRPSLDTLPSAPEPVTESFWPLVRLEVSEAGLLLGVNGILCLLVAWLVGANVPKVYDALWHFLLPVHAAISWATLMVPITLAGQSPVMGTLGLLLDSAQPERRIAFSLFHLISVLLFPISFLCLLLTPYHRTLAEILTGQEILMRPLPRMK